MKKVLRTSAAIAATMFILGCKETTSSEFIRTGGIAAIMSVTADNPDTSTVHVELRVGGATSNTYVILDGGDELSASTDDGETGSLTSVAEGVYEGKFKTAKEVEFTVSLDRTEDEDAPNSKAMLPSPFVISLPAEDAAFSRAEESFTISWIPVVSKSDGGQITISGGCIQTAVYDIAGTEGMITVDKDVLKSSQEDKPESCKVDIVLSFSDHGTPDVAFDADSQFTTKQSRKVTITSNP